MNGPFERRSGGRTLPLSEDLVRALVDAVDDDPHGTRTETICDRLQESPQRLGDAFEFVKEKGILLGFAGVWIHPERYEDGVTRFLDALSDAHRTDPTRGVVPAREIAMRAELEWPAKTATRIAGELVRSGRLRGDEEGVRLPDFSPKVGVKQDITLTRLAAILDSAGFRPPVGPGLALAVNLPTQAMREILRLGEHTGRLVPMEEGIWTTPDVLDRAHAELARAAKNGVLTIGEARTALDASRRYAHAFLDRLAHEGRARSVDGEWRVL